jgi:ATP-binding cassette subfamily B protein/subfamily B ATP-binding cassette protein MsbA
MIVIMLVIDWHFALLALALVPLLYLMTRHYLGKIKSIQRLARRADGQASAVAQEVLSSMTVVQAFGAEASEADRYAAATDTGLEENRRAIIAQSEFTPLMTLAMTLSTVIVVYFGVRSIDSGKLTAGDLLVFMAYLRGMYSPVRQLSKLAGVVGRAHAAAERVVEILDTHEEVPQRPDARRVTRARGAIAWRDVSFSYPEGGLVLDGVNLEIPAGTRQALVGLTGSGKSTLLRMVPRFLDPTAGTVFLDGHDVADLALEDLRRQVAFVPQEPYLFRATVWENIVYASAETSREKAMDIARRAGIHDVVESFRDGYDTLIGERGVSLSGGQRQCVAVARAMARNAPVLLLDEPTVGLDAELESVVLAALEIAAQGRTTIIVSHQLSGLRWADRIAVLNGGRIIETGTHDSLMADRRMYWNLNRTLDRHHDPVALAGAPRR